MFEGNLKLRNEYKCNSNQDQIDNQRRNLVQIIVWNESGNMVEILDETRTRSDVWNDLQKHNLLAVVHDWGESSCSSSIRKLIKSLYEAKPDHKVITFDYSNHVIMFACFACGHRLFSFVILGL